MLINVSEFVQLIGIEVISWGIILCRTFGIMECWNVGIPGHKALKRLAKLAVS